MLRRLTGSFIGQKNPSERSKRRSGSGVGEAAGDLPEGCTSIDGFAALPDPETFELSEKYIAPFSLPQEALSFEPDAGTIVHTFKNGDTERKLHLNIDLTEDELDLLRQLREQAKAQGIAFLPSMIVVATRYLSQARGKVDSALAVMERSNAWRLEYYQQPMAEASILEDMRHGIAYFCGRDRCLRPTLVFRAKRIPAQWHREKNYDRVVSIMAFCMEYHLRHLVVPGRAEGINVLCDLADMGIAQVPVSALTEMHKTMGNHYTGRVYKFYICNMSWVLKSLVAVAKRTLSDRQNQKLVFIGKKEELREEFALHQLEEDLGGTSPVFTEFLPFALKAGPFEAGYAGGADPSRVPNVHKALTKLGHRGRLWDPQRSAEENRQLDYTEAAEDILTQCGLPIPANCPRRRAEAAPGEAESPPANLKNEQGEAKEPLCKIANFEGEEADRNDVDSGKVDVESGKAGKEVAMPTTSSPIADPDVEDDVVVQDAKVNSGFLFMCCAMQTRTAGGKM